MSKYYIDIRLQPQWQSFGIDPDQIDWISDESFFSTGERDEVWLAVVDLLARYESLLYRYNVQTSRKHRSQYKNGRSLNDAQARLSNDPKGVTAEEINELRDRLKGLIG